jgi:integrase
MDPQPPNAPLFNLGAGKAFTKQAFRTAMSKGLLETGYNPRNLTGHSFRHGAAQHASDLGMLHHEIQLLGQWSSDAFKLYFTATPR